MPSKKTPSKLKKPLKKRFSREQALAWSCQGEPAPSVLAWGHTPSKASLQAAAVLVGFPAPQCVAKIAARFERIEAAFTAKDELGKRDCG